MVAPLECKAEAHGVEQIKVANIAKAIVEG